MQYCVSTHDYARVAIKSPAEHGIRLPIVSTLVLTKWREWQVANMRPLLYHIIIILTKTLGIMVWIIELYS